MSHNPSSSASSSANLDRFFKDVEVIKDELKEVERIHRRLDESNEASKTLHAVRNLRARMDGDVGTALKKAKLIKLRLESLDRANAVNYSLPCCGPGTSTNRTHTSVVAGLRKKLKDSMEGFGELWKTVTVDYWEFVERCYYTATEKKPDEQTVEALVATGEGKRFLQRAIEEQGRVRVLDVITEIQERHTAAADLERSLLELHQVFMDMSVLRALSVLVATQGEQLDDIESQVGQAQFLLSSSRRVFFEYVVVAVTLARNLE
ncbi:syntaxin-121-like [Phoenix dactylifera]|uniref:Syntaxin-121-like n=1 Tax=Phoenix dactylifera TaxID=42345 RepID=A0A8B8ZNK6_PHODC|nr:syntaxin-121-like [Phoenix dactylifera]